MRYRLCLCCLVFLVVFAPGCIASPAHVGSAFADAYSAFAPLYTLYRSYAEYLFRGSAVVVPPGLESACQSCSTRLDSLQMTFIVQTDSPYTEEVGYVVRLRERVTSFCENYREPITAIASAESIDLSFLAQADEDDLFASISDLNTLFDKTLNLTIENLEEASDRWMFNTAFATRTLMNQEKIERIHFSLELTLLTSSLPEHRSKEIMEALQFFSVLNDRELPAPPENLPEEIMKALQSLAALTGRELSPQERAQAGTLARSIHAFLVQGD